MRLVLLTILLITITNEQENLQDETSYQEDDDGIQEGEPEFIAKQTPDFFRKYYDLGPIYRYLNNLVDLHSHIATKERLTKTVEERNVMLYKIGRKNKNPKPIIWIDAGLHAAEWTAPAAAVYIASQLMKWYLQIEEIKELVDKFDWYILPVANPDGYSFSRSAGGMGQEWLKNRASNPDGSQGVNLDKNFGYNWNFSNEQWIREPSSLNYQGPKAFSEKETRAISKFLTNNKEDLAVYLSLHSTGQSWLMPWRYTIDFPKDYSDMYELGEIAVRALDKVNGNQYRIGSASTIIGESSGSSIDWVYGELGVQYAYKVIIGHPDYEFYVPEKKLFAAVTETWHAVMEMAKSLIKSHCL